MMLCALLHHEILETKIYALWAYCFITSPEHNQLHSL